MLILSSLQVLVSSDLVVGLSSSSRNLEVSLMYDAISWFRDVSLVLMNGSCASFNVPFLIFPRVSGKFKGLSKVIGKLQEGWSRRVKFMTSISKDFMMAFISKSIFKTHMASEENPRVEVIIDSGRITVPDFMVANLIASRGRVRKPGFLWYEKPLL